MKYKRTMLILVLVLCAVLSASAVMAADADDAYAAGPDENQTAVESEGIAGQTDNGTFTALQKKIENASDYSTVTLENDYFYDEGFAIEGIEIARPMTIDGKGHKIDARSQSRIFYMDVAVTLKNITFINAHAADDGGAICNTGDGCIITSCNFINTSTVRLKHGGAVFNEGKDLAITSCNFTDF